MTAPCGSGAHDWRLIDEKPEIRRMTTEELAERESFAARYAAVTGSKPRFFNKTTQTGATEFRWYCTRCRIIETTVAKYEEDEA